MARRPALIAKKTKKPRVTRNEAYLVNLKYLGDEPVFTKPLTEGEYGRALNWYNYMCDNNDAREYIETYLKSNNRITELKKFKRVPDNGVNTTSAWIARMLTKGYLIPQTSKSFFEEKLKHSLSKAEEKEETKLELPKISIQDRIRERTQDIIGDIEELIDSGEEFSLYDWLKGKEIPATYCSAIIAHYNPWLADMIEAHEGKDEQLKEAYRYLTKKQLKQRIEFFDKLLDDVERYGSVTKKTRAPRKPRTVSVEKKLKSFKYQKEDNTFKIASVNPEKIIGAQELWTFNTKYKTLTVFRALDRGGLQVKGTSIINYDEKNSFTKRTGRKPEEYVKKVLDGGKIVLRKIMDELKNDAALAYRINENTILLKITA
jgi:hypothetical protein